MRLAVKDYVTYANKKYNLSDPILDVCAGWEPNLYESIFDGKVYLKQDQMQFDPPTMDFVCDAHQMDPIDSGSIGTVLLLEALEHIRQPQLVVDEIYRILRPGGICVATTVMTFEIHRTPYDYWRFCPDGLSYLFRSFHILEIVLEHHRTLPRGIWSIAIKPDVTKDNVDYIHDNLIPIKIVESGRSKMKNFIKLILNKFGIDIVRVSRKPDTIGIIGTNKDYMWKEHVK